MSALRMGTSRSAAGLRRGFLAIGAAVLLAGCTTGTATPTPAALPTAASSVAAATATPTSTTLPTPTDTPTVAPTPAGPLCTASQLVAAVMIWHTIPGGIQGDFFAGSYTSTSGGRLCYLSGTARGEMVSAGAVIADSGASSAGIAAGDPYYPLEPGGRVYASVVWSNWCPARPRQPVTIAFVLPNGLGRVVANTSGPTPVPSCVSSGSPTAVTSARWHPTYP
jgi:hypothetical protein